MGGLVAVHLTVIGQYELPGALNTPTIEQRCLGFVDVGDVVGKALAKDGAALDGRATL